MGWIIAGMLIGLVVCVILLSRIRTGGARLVHRPADPYPYDFEIRRLFGWSVVAGYKTKDEAIEVLAAYKAKCSVLRFGATPGIVIGTL